MLENQAASITKLVKLGVDGCVGLHLKVNWESKLEI
jgi:hypothetical protein